MLTVTVTELESRWRSLSEEETTRAAALLADAGLLVEQAAIAAGRDPEIDLDPRAVTLVVCAAVKRAMVADMDRGAVSTVQQTAGPFSESLNFVNPTGDLYLTRAERRTLGLGGTRTFAIHPNIRGGETS